MAGDHNMRTVWRCVIGCRREVTFRHLIVLPETPCTKATWSLRTRLSRRRTTNLRCATSRNRVTGSVSSIARGDQVEGSFRKIPEPPFHSANLQVGRN